MGEAGRSRVSAAPCPAAGEGIRATPRERVAEHVMRFLASRQYSQDITGCSPVPQGDLEGQGTALAEEGGGMPVMRSR